MARGRMISKSLSTSEKYAALVPLAGELYEFCHALYPLVIPHTDDFGRLQGDPFTVKHACYPASLRTLDEFAAALGFLDRVKLVSWYSVAGKKYLQVENFDPHQQGLHKRTRSQFPRVPGNSGNGAELPGQEKGTEAKRREEKYPLTPFSAKRGRLTRQELKEAKEIRLRTMSSCQHDPRCRSFNACVQAIALLRRES